MKTKSTYSLLVNAQNEEKGRSIFEISAFALVLLCMAISGWHFAITTVALPQKNSKPEVVETMIAGAPVAPTPAAIAARG